MFTIGVKYQPNLVLLDLGLPGMRGLDVITKLKKRWHKLKIICVSATTMNRRLKKHLMLGPGCPENKQTIYFTKYN